MSIDSHIDPEEARVFTGTSPAAPRMIPADHLRISDHASRCPVCHALLRSVSKSRPPDERTRMINDLRAMAAGARGAAEREEDDLRAFASHLESFPEEQFAPGETLPAPARPGANRTQPIRSWWKLLLVQPAPWAAAAAVIAVTAVLGVSSFSGGRKVRTSSSTSLRDGPLTVAGDGTLHGATSLPDDLRAALAKIVRERRLSLPGTSLGSMRGETADPRHVGQSPSRPPFPLQPPAGSVVEDVHPVLRWAEVPGAAGYTVVVTSLSTDAVAANGRLPASINDWRCDQALTRGTIYRWMVQADTGLEGGRPAASATLKVLGTADEDELQRLRAGFQGSHLVLAYAYLRLNLREEAKAELHALQTANPGSVLARDMAGSLP